MLLFTLMLECERWHGYGNVVELTLLADFQNNGEKVPMQ